MLWFKKQKKKEKGPPGHQTNFQKSIDQNQSFFYSWPNIEYDIIHKCFMSTPYLTRLSNS